MHRFILPALVLVLASCTQPVEEERSTAEPSAPDLKPSYAPGEGPEPPEGYCQPFTTHKQVHSPLALEIDLLYCYQYSDFLARLYVYEHGGISCGQLGHLYAPYIDETWHCGSKWYIWVPY
jgi:hypothetical protein